MELNVLSGDTINIRPSVDTSELESYLAMLDQALLKQERLTSSAVDSLGTSAGGGVGGVRSATAQAVRNVQHAQGQLDLMGNRVVNLKDEIKGVETFIHRVARMVPGVREADRFYRNIERMNSGYQMIAMLNIGLIMFRVIRMIDQYLKKIDQEKREMEAMIRQSQEFTRGQYKEWQVGQAAGIRQAREQSRLAR